MTNAVITAQQGSTQHDFGFKNRVINGDMRIDQRNVGTAVTTILQTSRFSVDRWSHYGDVAARLTLQQSTSAPPGFTNSLLATVIATDATGPQQFIAQIIEGYNIADFAWGTSNAIAVSLSFWVRSNLSGQFGGSLQNYNTSRSYPFAYTINSANTWEYKTVTIAPETVGSWQTSNNHGVRLLFELGAGYQKTPAGAWVSSNTTSSLGSTNLCGTLGATWQVTGVQLETGSAATGFDYRNFGTELAMCQRYYEKSYSYSVRPGDANSWASTHSVSFPKSASTAFDIRGIFQVQKRSSSATMLYYNPTTGSTTTGRCEQVQVNNVDFNYTIGTAYVTSYGYMARVVATANPGGLADSQSYMTYNYTAESEL